MTKYKWIYVKQSISNRIFGKKIVLIQFSLVSISFSVIGFPFLLILMRWIGLLFGERLSSFWLFCFCLAYSPAWRIAVCFSCFSLAFWMKFACYLKKKSILVQKNSWSTTVSKFKNQKKYGNAGINKEKKIIQFFV